MFEGDWQLQRDLDSVANVGGTIFTLGVGVMVVGGALAFARAFGRKQQRQAAELESLRRQLHGVAREVEALIPPSPVEPEVKEQQ